jgi:hypothetical protein
MDYAINERTHVWLHSMTPKQEVSKFLCNRAIMLDDVGRHGEALQAIDAAERFNPINPACAEIRHSILGRWQLQSPLSRIAFGSAQIRPDGIFDAMTALIKDRIDAQRRTVNQ